ncbi:MAG: hypothetical protein ACM33T_15190 [Solirubrobacterales bacterium]
MGDRKKAGGYVLILSDERRVAFEGQQWIDDRFAEPVPDFAHSRSLPLICFLSAQKGMITHIGRAKRGYRAGTGLRRLNIEGAQELTAPIDIPALTALIPLPLAKAVSARLADGGLLSEKGFGAVVEAVITLSPETAALLNRFSLERAARIERLSSRTRMALAYQKEAVATALSLAGMGRETLQAWSPPKEEPPTSFLDGLPEVRLREDPMVINDLANLPGYQLLKVLPYAAAVFQGKNERLTVILANRQLLEEQFGTDLIYYNETFKSFVMVQYKAMEKASGESDWGFRLPNEQLDAEVARMDEALQALRQCTANACRDGFRLSDSPFFLKMCPRLQFNPDDIGLVRGMYFPLDHWRFVAADPALIGPRGGRRLTFENAGRYLDNTSFLSLVAKAWIGTTPNQSAVLETAIRAIIQSGRTVALAVKKDAPDPPTATASGYVGVSPKDEEVERQRVHVHRFN